MMVMSFAAHLVTRRRARDFNGDQPSFVGQSLDSAIDGRDSQSGHLLLRQLQHLFRSKRPIVSLEDLQYFTALLCVPSKSLR